MVVSHCIYKTCNLFKQYISLQEVLITLQVLFPSIGFKVNSDYYAY